jgi:hypothetical protein
LFAWGLVRGPVWVGSADSTGAEPTVVTCVLAEGADVGDMTDTLAEGADVAELTDVTALTPDTDMTHSYTCRSQTGI